MAAKALWFWEEAAGDPQATLYRVCRIIQTKAGIFRLVAGQGMRWVWDEETGNFIKEYREV